MLTISTNEILDRFEFDNPWWTQGEGIEERFAGFPRRFYFNSFITLIQDRSVNRAVVVMGPRRVGKTVMVYHAIQALLDDGVPGNSIFYMSLETPLYSGIALEKMLNLFQKHFEHKKDDQLYIFFDEVQYLRDWEIHLKSLVDSYASYRFAVTGSAAAALKLKSQESGAGRFTDFVLPPLTFSEYINFIKRKDELIETNKILTRHGNKYVYRARDIDELNKEFCNYLNFGGYPEAVMSKVIQQDPGRYIKSDIIDKVLLRDLPSLYGISDIQELNRLFTTLAYNTGNEITLEGLSKSAGVAKNTIKRYLEYLEAAFLIRRVNRIDNNARHFKRATSFKVYLTNPSMRSALFGSIGEDGTAMGHLVETAIY
ncbi:MAG: ATP-binding protein, partial [Candidatus Nitrotoga sp.]